MARKFFKSLLTLLIIALITLVIAEVLCRLFFPLITGKQFDVQKLSAERLDRLKAVDARLKKDKLKKGFYILHPYFGYTLRNHFPFNELGPFEPPPDSATPAVEQNEFTIGIFGGSVATIFTHDSADEIIRALSESIPYFRDKKIKVIDLAMAAHKQPQQLFRLQYALLAGLKLDAVVNLDGFNDLALAVENIQNDITFIFPSGHHYAFLSKVINDDFNPEDVELLHSLYKTLRTEKSVINLADGGVLKRSALMSAIANATMDWSQKQVKRYEYDLVLGTVKVLPDELKGPVNLNPTHDIYKAAAYIWMKSSLLMNDFCRRNDMRYFHFLQPNQYVPGARDLTAREREIAYNEDYSRRTSVVEGYHYLIDYGRVLKEKGVNFTDLTMIFKHTNYDIYVDDCCHVNKEGNLIMAREVARVIAASYSGSE